MFFSQLNPTKAAFDDQKVAAFNTWIPTADDHTTFIPFNDHPVDSTGVEEAERHGRSRAANLVEWIQKRTTPSHRKFGNLEKMVIASSSHPGQ